MTRELPAWAARPLAAALEYGARALRTGEPPLTRFLANQLTTAHWFDITAARRDLGYEPRVTTDEGLRRLRAALHRARRAESGERPPKHAPTAE